MYNITFYNSNPLNPHQLFMQNLSHDVWVAVGNGNSPLQRGSGDACSKPYVRKPMSSYARPAPKKLQTTEMRLQFAPDPNHKSPCTEHLPTRAVWGHRGTPLFWDPREWLPGGRAGPPQAERAALGSPPLGLPGPTPPAPPRGGRRLL